MVEIIPKKVSLIPQWLTVLFYLAFVLLVFSVFAFFILNSSLGKSQKALADLELALEERMTPQKIVLEKEILGYQKKISDFFSLLQGRLKIFKVFNLIEKDCHPKISFQQFSLDSQEAEIVLSGKADSFESLSQQILIFKRENLIRTVDLEQVLIDQEGKVGFRLFIFLNPNIFK
ncbi:MAG: hypothetical protein ABIG08_01775 [bacterium]